MKYFSLKNGLTNFNALENQLAQSSHWILFLFLSAFFGLRILLEPSCS